MRRPLSTVIGQGVPSRWLHFLNDMEMLWFSVGLTYFFGPKPFLYLFLSAYINESVLFQVRYTLVYTKNKIT